MERRTSIVAAAAIALGVASLSIVAATQPAAAQSEPKSQQRENAGQEPQAATATPPPGLFGDFGGLRSRLVKEGLTLRGHYVAESAANPSGGKQQGTAYASELMLGLDADLGKLAAKGLGTVHFTFTEREGSSLSQNAVDNVLTVQEIYGDGLTPRLTELSYEQPLVGGKIDLEAGRIITENDFADAPTYWGGNLYCEYQSNAICGTPIAAPIDSGYDAYPSSTFGLRVKGLPSKDFYAESGVYEVNPTIGLRNEGFTLSATGDTGVYLPVEFGFKHGDAPGERVGNVRFGGYLDTSHVLGAQSDLSRFVPAGDASLALVPQSLNAGRYGAWLQADQLLSGSGKTGTRGLATFGALEYGDPQTALITFFGDGGFVQHGTFRKRNDDTVALGFAFASFNPRLRTFEANLEQAGYTDVPVTTQERAIELNYGAQVTPWMLLRPGVQYVLNPSGTNTIPNAVVLDLSTSITF